jgi:hypothetical protein
MNSSGDYDYDGDGDYDDDDDALLENFVFFDDSHPFRLDSQSHPHPQPRSRHYSHWHWHWHSDLPRRYSHPYRSFQTDASLIHPSPLPSPSPSPPLQKTQTNPTSS